ncbi:Gfo/Idh/MocA family oxidoreductase [Paenibacillus sp. HB172176]|uniref:Gfo/Idh/MocA family protein n=1 Tax=Paenibacillus sp. HB172176 TaxID=2493690 RepID=UPI0014390392|nr:Gfo/Idh/MocA family oxidoreductase [Paenibacillus sp. HB172176]
MKEEIAIGMIGAGGIARVRHIPGLKKLRGVKLAAVANRSLASSKQAAEEFGFERYYENWREVADDPEVEAVFICTPPYMHKEMTSYALSRGKHVFCQARMAMDLEEALLMLEEDRSTSLTTMLCPPPHYMAVDVFVKHLIGDGQLGEVRHVVLQQVTPAYQDPDKPLHWRQTKAIQGINMLEVGMLGEVLNRWFGPLASLSANGATWVKERRTHNDEYGEVELPDSVSLTGEFLSGATLTALFSGSAAISQPFMLIHGSKASLQCHPDEPYVTLFTAEGERRVDIGKSELKGWTVEADFIQAVRNGVKGYPSFKEGTRYMAFTQAVKQSLDEGNGAMKVMNIH